ncbi:DUF190 domain-containing protein [Paenibacillus chondroitinus]|uniref:DUF190 domain-containing protein n=1 Tax=Paenibacillus chondroitinus TaxID=59842 RepID=A0ABU6DNI9_9BACL|nr:MULTISPECIES: DUF190 domain-containing protein [Paenibacillus]MCY9660570.1 DUF190 domain-containing protein [Paenibacillus anseongense]MEB4799330.1 DUF190 domain-containing protein [Paenibacillus chondroitinus]
MSLRLLQIVVGEFDDSKSVWRPLYHEVLQLLWKSGVDGATVVRTDEGIGQKNDKRSVLLEEDIPFSNLPLVIEAIDTYERLETILPELKGMIPHGAIALMEVINVLKEDLSMNDQSYLMLRVYVKEEAHVFQLANFEEILQLFQEHDLIWSTITKAIEGFGKDHVIHKQSLFTLSSHAPVIIECVGKAEKIRQIIPELRGKIGDGLAIAIPIQVIEDR